MTGRVALSPHPFLRSAQGASVLVALFLIVPIAVVIPVSFTAGTLLIYPLPGLSLRWYEEFLSDPGWLASVANSVTIGLATTAIATPLGTLAAIGLTRLEGRSRTLVTALLYGPLATPVIVFAVAAFYLYARHGLAGSLAGVVIGHVVLATPFVVIIVSATLQGFDRTLLRAAASLGAGPAFAFRRVTLPLIAPGVMSGAILAFVTSFDELVVTLFLASPGQRTLPRQIWAGVQESSSPTVVAAATILMGVSLCLMGLVEILRRRSRLSRSTP